ncbi:MAG TPA: alpha-amylase [Anaerolineaceae bacterium]|nr:alpha-amylase [Anaerolineaceae bacterium]
MISKKDLRSLVIYEIYVRNHSPRGDFQGVIDDLPRIKALGVDMIWLMPIHPIGKVGRKGSLGSSYAISDYLGINPEYGTLDDFKQLMSAAHSIGLKVMIDVVYNHTSPDSVLAQQHKDWFRLDEKGEPTTSVPDWMDIVELDHSHSELDEYLVKAIQYWAGLGLDGFRCDVASLVPLKFWFKARAAAAAINPAMIWLAESVHPDWVAERRENGLFALSDSELFQVFDITYDYDIFRPWERTVKGYLNTRYYLDLLCLQEAIYPEDYVKLRFVENHDTDRVMEIAPTYEQALAWIALQAFNKGAWLIYAGEESAAPCKPSHFEKDVIPWGDYRLTDFIHCLALLKKDAAVKNGNLTWLTSDPLIQAAWSAPSTNLAGIFNTSGVKGEIPTVFSDGTYQDLLSGEDFVIKDQRLLAPGSVFIFYCPAVNTQLERETVLI